MGEGGPKSKAPLPTKSAARRPPLAHCVDDVWLRRLGGSFISPPLAAAGVHFITYICWMDGSMRNIKEQNHSVGTGEVGQRVGGGGTQLMLHSIVCITKISHKSNEMVSWPTTATRASGFYVFDSSVSQLVGRNPCWGVELF